MAKALIMFQIKEYTIEDTIYQGKHFLIYRAIRNNDQKKVILKVCRLEQPSFNELAALRHEYKLLKRLKLSNVVEAYDLIQYQHKLILVIEDMEGISLQQYLEGKPIGLNDFFKISIQLTDGLSGIHSHHIIHRDINPNNIIINPTSLDIKIIDFGISSELSQEISDIQQVEQFEGTLKYLAPEQTGRMNHVTDFRADFYSLGIIMYQMLIGKVPFDSDDPLELVYSHLAKYPPTVTEINPKIPSQLAALVRKLLAKTPEERYASATGLKADLVECQRQWFTHNAIKTFPLGQSDVHSHLVISQKLYGRENKVNQLLSTFERISNGTKELLLISGYSGIGKTSLIKEIYSPITKQRGYFINGKFDQLQRATPYSAFIGAFHELVRRLLAEPQERLDKFKNELLTVLENNGQVILDLIPSLELIIGPQPSVMEISPNESQKRFMLALQGLIRVLAKKKHPLVIFLDDMQWADSASMQLIYSLFNDNSIEHFLLISAYRDNEVEADHPFMATVQQLQKASIKITTIKLDPLKIADVQHLLIDSLNCSKESAPLATLLVEKTQGNPFFINQFLKQLYNNKLLTFSYELQQWDWDIEYIKKQSMTDNVIDLLITRIHKLPEATQDALKYATCIGHQFDLKVLSVISEKTIVELAEQLWPAVQDSLVIPDDYRLIEGLTTGVMPDQPVKVNYYFAHDRIQQAAYQLIPDEQKKVMHFSIGHLLLKQYPTLQLNDKIVFEIADQFNQGLVLIRTPEDRQQIATINLWAGKQAKLSSAYAAAADYFQHGIKILTEQAWEYLPELIFELYLGLAECQFLVNEAAAAEHSYNLLLQHTKDKIKIGKIYKTKIITNMACNKHEQALNEAIEVIKLLGISIPNKVNLFHVLKSILGMKLLLAGNRLNKLESRPATVPNQLVLSDLLLEAPNLAYEMNPNLYVVLVNRCIAHSVKYGYGSVTPSALIGYASLLIFEFKQFNEGLKVIRAAASINEKMKNSKIDARFEIVTCLIFSYLIKPLHIYFDDLGKARQKGIEAGEIHYALYALGTKVLVRYMITTVSETAEIIIQYLNYTEKQGITEFEKNYRYLYEQIKFLSNDNPKFDPDLIKILHAKDGHSNKTEIAVIYSMAIKFCYIMNEFSHALRLSNEMRQGKYHEFMKGLLFDFESRIYYGLALAANYRSASDKDKKIFFKELLIVQKDVQIWAKWCPINFEVYSLLISAEISRLKGDRLSAIDGYDAAIKLAQEYKILLMEAIANECASRFYLEQNQPRIAKVYLLAAHYTFEQWGGIAKCRLLEQQYPDWFETSTHVKATATTTATINSTELSLGSIDALSLLKAAQAMSSEIRLDCLLQKLLIILLQTAGAQCGILLVKNKNNWCVEAEGTAESQKVSVIQAEAIQSRNDIALSLISYAERTQKMVLLQDAKSLEPYLHHDAYLARVKPESILVLPILFQGKLQRILYLENHSSKYAFTTDHIQTLLLLASQAAISLENAQLYYQATHDPLTGLANRNLLYQTFGQAVAPSDSKKLAILFIDLDGFKTINDTLGHEVGDKLLLHFSECLKSVIAEKDLAVRLGGDEFILMMDDIKNIETVSKVAERLLAGLKKPVKIMEHEIQIKSSIGISLYPNDASDIHDLLKFADIALYKVKATGKNHYQFYKA